MPGTVTQLSVTDRVARGIKRFDGIHPGWHRKVDLDSLDVQSGNACPLSQVFGSFAEGVVAVFNPPEVKPDPSDRRKARGRTYRGAGIGDLAAIGCAADPSGGDEYPALNAAWRDAVRSRLEF